MTPLELKSRQFVSVVELRNSMLALAERVGDPFKEDIINLLQKRFGENYQRDLIYDWDLPPPPVAEEEHKKVHELPGTRESSLAHLLSRENAKASLGHFVEQVVSVQGQETSHGFWSSKVPITSQNLRNRRNHVERSYHKVRKRKMKHDYSSQSLRLTFRTRSPRNLLYLGDDRLNSMAVIMARERQHTSTRRAHFKQRFHQFQKRRSKERYRVVIASFRSKHKSWVVAKKKERNSFHTFSFPPLNQLTMRDGDVISHDDYVVTIGKEFLESSLTKEVCEGVIAKHVYGNCLDECYKGDGMVMITQKAGELSLLKNAGTFLKTVKERSDGIVDAKKLHGTDEKQIIGSSMINRVFWNESRLFGSSFFSQVWDPGEMLAGKIQLDWLVVCVGCYRIVDDVKHLAFRVCTSNKQPTDPGRADRVWECGRLDVSKDLWEWLMTCCKHFEVFRLMLRFREKGLQWIRKWIESYAGYEKEIMRQKLHLYSGYNWEKPLELLDVQLSENHSQERFFLFIHLEDKVCFSGASNSMKGEWNNDKAPKLMVISFMATRLGLQNYFVMNCASEGHNFLMAYDCLEMQDFYSFLEFSFRSEKDTCADVYLQEINKSLRCQSNISERTTYKDRILEIGANGLDAERGQQVQLSLERILGKRPREPGRFNKYNQCGLESKQVWWGYLERLIIQKQAKGKEAGTREQKYEAGVKKLTCEEISQMLSLGGFCNVGNIVGEENMVYGRLLELNVKMLGCSGEFSLEAELDQVYTRIEEELIKDAGSDMYDKILMVLFELSLLGFCTSLKVKPAQGKRDVVCEEVVATQTVLRSKWEQVVLSSSRIQLILTTLSAIYGNGAFEVNWVGMNLSLGVGSKVSVLIGFFFHFLPP